MKNNIKKKQHYYPKFLMKYFANENGKLYTYIRKINKTQYIDYKLICAENYFYETDEVVEQINLKKNMVCNNNRISRTYPKYLRV